MYHGRNRNRSYISKSVAEKIANTLPGTPIVGVFMDKKNDFDDHGERLAIKDGKFTTERITKSFGYVPEDTKVWWETFEENGVKRDYMMCEGKLWTKRYPEAQRIINEGNWQSMELEPTSMKGEWMNMDYSKDEDRTFVVEDAAFLGLCILGKDVPPCFETAAIGAPGSLFSFINDNSIRNQMSSFNLGDEIALNEGGNEEMSIGDITNAEIAVIENTEETAPVVEETPVVEEQVEETPVVEETPTVEETPEEPAQVEEPEQTEEEVVEDEASVEEKEEEVTEPVVSQVEQDLVVTKARLVEVEALLAQALADVESNKEELFSLREMKANIDKQEKESMFAKFYMLNEEDIAPIRAEMDSFTVAQIEEKLSVVAFRNKVNFNLETEDDKKDDVIVSYSASTVDTLPAWLKAVENVKNKRK